MVHCPSALTRPAAGAHSSGFEQDYLQLKDELGLDHYEGRNWAGWHHHISMVMVAHAFLTLESLRTKKNFWVDPATDAT